MSPDPRLVALLERSGADALLSADPGVARQLTGHVPWLETGPSPFAPAAMVLAGTDGPAWLVAAADAGDHGAATVSYAGFGADPRQRLERAGTALGEALARSGLAGRRIAVDAASVPEGIAALVRPGVPPVGLELLGAVKTEAEVAAIAAAAQLADVAQAAARDATVPGASELEVFHTARAAMECVAGERVTVGADLVSGARCAGVGGPPSSRQIGEGDAVLCDLSPHRDGIWADSCATWVVGEPDLALARAHAVALDALRDGLARMRPGVVAGELDGHLRAVLADAGLSYPHHSGHGVGFSAHEEPRIVPGADIVLETGMVVALEPGAYDARTGLGVRVEQIAVVTEAGGRALSGHPLELAR